MYPSTVDYRLSLAICRLLTMTYVCTYTQAEAMWITCIVHIAITLFILLVKQFEIFEKNAVIFNKENIVEKIL